MDRELKKMKDVFWASVAAEEKSQEAIIDKAKALLACSKKASNKGSTLREADLKLMTKKLPKSPQGQINRLEKLASVIESVSYDEEMENFKSVSHMCPKESKAFFEAKKNHLLAETRSSIARIRLH